MQQQPLKFSFGGAGKKTGGLQPAKARPVSASASITGQAMTVRPALGQATAGQTTASRHTSATTTAGPNPSTTSRKRAALHDDSDDHDSANDGSDDAKSHRQQQQQPVYITDASALLDVDERQIRGGKDAAVPLVIPLDPSKRIGGAGVGVGAASAVESSATPTSTTTAPKVYGLQIMRKSDTTVKQKEETRASVITTDGASSSTMAVDDASPAATAITAQPIDADAEAIAMLTGTSTDITATDASAPTLAIPLNQRPLLARNTDETTANTSHLSETARFRLDMAARPDSAAVSTYARIPVADFGAALLRGMGWTDPVDDKDGNKDDKIHVVERRQALLGLGAKPSALPSVNARTSGKPARKMPRNK